MTTADFTPPTAPCSGSPGPDARDFLQGLVTNDVRRLDQGAVYAALLSPQGKYLFDFFLVADGADVLVDVKADRAARSRSGSACTACARRSTIAPADLAVVVGLGDPPAGRRRRPARSRRSAGAPRPPTRRALLAGVAPLDPAELDRPPRRARGARDRRRAPARRQLHPGDGLRAAERRRLPQGLLRRPGGHRADEAQDRAAQGPGARPPRRPGRRRPAPRSAPATAPPARSTPPPATAGSPTCASTGPRAPHRRHGAGDAGGMT